ncbi:uncharacterized protein J3R85_004025 [Psidium guajava]|nr:uncharacterized protein J3R85_004025 [Psidium guajava]
MNEGFNFISERNSDSRKLAMLSSTSFEVDMDEGLPVGGDKVDKGPP